MMIRRLLASVLGDRRQPQIMKHEQAWSANRNGGDVLVRLSLAWFVALSGAAIWVLSSPALYIFG
jgi:hypothetical protein